MPEGNQNATGLSKWQSFAKHLRSEIQAGQSETSFFLWEGAGDDITLEFCRDSLVVRPKPSKPSNAHKHSLDPQTRDSAHCALAAAIEELEYDGAQILPDRFADFAHFQADVLFQSSPLRGYGFMPSPDPVFLSYVWPCFFACQCNSSIFVRDVIIPSLLRASLPAGRCLVIILIFRWMSEESAWHDVVQPALTHAVLFKCMA